VFREWFARGEKLLGNVLSGFGGRAEECWQLTPAHLEASWDYKLDWFVVKCKEDVTKMPGIIGAYDKMPEAILDIPFGKKQSRFLARQRPWHE